MEAGSAPSPLVGEGGGEGEGWDCGISLTVLINQPHQPGPLKGQVWATLPRGARGSNFAHSARKSKSILNV